MADNTAFDGEDIVAPNTKEVTTTSCSKQETCVKDESAQSTVCSIDRHMLSSKIAYSLAGAYTGSFTPFVNVFLTSIGLTFSEAGFIGGIRLVTASIAGPIWGLIADYTGYRKLIFVILCVGASLTIFSLPWVAREITVAMDNTSVQERLLLQRSHKCSYNVVSTIDDHAAQINDYSYKDNNTFGFTGSLFYAMLILISISNIFDVPLQGIIDSFVMNVANLKETSVCFGMQRVFGSVSFGIANFIAGVAADHYYQPKFMSKYTAVFYVFMPCIILLLPAGLVLLKQTKWDTVSRNPCDDQNKVGKTKLLIKTFRHFDNLFFILSVFLVGIANGVLYGFLFMLMDHEMNASKSIMGLAVMIACCTQVVTFPFSDRIIKRVGALNCIEIGTFAYFIRFMSVSFITNPWLVIPTQLLHCLCFALFWAASIEQVQVISPKEIYVTMYSILTSVYYGVGGVVGNIVGGVVFTHWGGRILFRATAILCGVWTLVMVIYYGVLKKLIKKKKNISVVPKHDVENETELHVVKES